LRRSYSKPGVTEYLTQPSIPDPAAVRAIDPSESVRSAQILEAVRSAFEIVACREIGGTILQFLLANIAGNFRSDDSDSIDVLRLLFHLEDTLLKVGEIQSDFMVIVAQPKPE